MADTIDIRPRDVMLQTFAGEYTRDILVDPRRCTGCGDCIPACEQAIAHEHDLTGSKPVPRIDIVEEQGAFIPLLCQNCSEFPCVEACLTGCRHKDYTSGWVVTDYDRCVGCWMCVMACPFGVIKKVEEDHIARKCDGCLDYEVPPCVDACEPGALQVGGVGDWAQRARLTDALATYCDQPLSSIAKQQSF